MPITLVVEDGSIVPNANTYVEVADLEAYAEARGAALPVDEEAKKVLLIKAMDYLESRRSEYKGSRVSGAQPLAWPRSGVVLYAGEDELPSTTLPVDLLRAQSALAIISQTVDLLPTVGADVRGVKREKIGPIETEYFGMGADGSSLTSPILSSVDALLAVLLDEDSGGFSLTVMRA